MSHFFSFLQYEGCMNVVFIRLWELVRERFLAVAAETQMSAGYVAKAIWLAMDSEPEKVPLFKRGMEENLDVSTLFIVKYVAHIKKSALEFLLISSKTYLGSLNRFSLTSTNLCSCLPEVWQSS